MCFARDSASSHYQSAHMLICQHSPAKSANVRLFESKSGKPAWWQPCHKVTRNLVRSTNISLRRLRSSQSLDCGIGDISSEAREAIYSAVASTTLEMPVLESLPWGVAPTQNQSAMAMRWSHQEGKWTSRAPVHRKDTTYTVKTAASSIGVGSNSRLFWRAPMTSEKLNEGHAMWQTSRMEVSSR